MAKIGRRFSKKRKDNRQGERNDLRNRAEPQQEPPPAPPTTRNHQVVDYREESIFVDDDDDAKQPALDLRRTERLMVALMFEKDYDSEELTAAIVKDIRKRSKLGKDFRIKRVIEDYLTHRALGRKFSCGTIR